MKHSVRIDLLQKYLYLFGNIIDRNGKKPAFPYQFCDLNIGTIPALTIAFYKLYPLGVYDFFHLYVLLYPILFKHFTDKSRHTDITLIIQNYIWIFRFLNLHLNAGDFFTKHTIIGTAMQAFLAILQGKRNRLVTVHAPTNSDTILCNEGVNSNPFAHKMLKCKHFGARFSLLLLTSEQ